MLEISGILDIFWKSVSEVQNDPLFPYYILAGFLLYLLFTILEKMNFRSLLQIVNDWLAREKNDKGTVKIFTYLVILGFCVAGICMVFMMVFMVQIGKTQTSAINDFFEIKYQNEIKPQSESEINQIVNDTKSISNISERLDKIAEWETKNFTDLYWHQVSVKSLNPYTNSYAYDSTGKIRASHSSIVNTPFAEDPYWITYFKFGACGEEAALFANVTNRTGIITRPIVLDLGYWEYNIKPVQTGNHAFLEVQVSETEWYYYDPTVYGADHILNESPCKNGKPCINRWFGKPDQYNYFSAWQVLRIYRGDTNEDVSGRYTKMSGSIQKSKFFYVAKEPIELNLNKIPEIFRRCDITMSNSFACVIS